MRSSGMSDLEELMKRSYPDIKSDDSDTETCDTVNIKMNNKNDNQNRGVVSHTEWEKFETKQIQKPSEKLLSSNKNQCPKSELSSSSSSSSSSTKIDNKGNKSPTKKFTKDFFSLNKDKDKDKEKEKCTSEKEIANKKDGKSLSKDDSKASSMMKDEKKKKLKKQIKDKEKEKVEKEKDVNKDIRKDDKEKSKDKTKEKKIKKEKDDSYSSSRSKSSPSTPPETPEITNSPTYSYNDNESSQDSKLEEEINEQARLIEEYLKDENSDNSFNGPLTPITPTAPVAIGSLVKPSSKEDKQQTLRRYEEEAAIQSLRLQKELMETSIMIKPELLSPVALVKPDIEIVANVEVQPCDDSIYSIQNSSNSKDEFSIDDSEEKELSTKESELEDQRKMEDDLAVAALLEDMNPIKGPEDDAEVYVTPPEHIDQMNHYMGMLDDEEPPLQIDEEPPPCNEDDQLKNITNQVTEKITSTIHSAQIQNDKDDVYDVNINKINQVTQHLKHDTHDLIQTQQQQLPISIINEVISTDLKVSSNRSTNENMLKENNKTQLNTSNSSEICSVIKTGTKLDDSITSQESNELVIDDKRELSLDGSIEKAETTEKMQTSTELLKDKKGTDESSLLTSEKTTDENRDESETDDKKCDRPRRGRRAKTRKYSESSLQLPRYETGCANSNNSLSTGSSSTTSQSQSQSQHQQVQQSVTPSKRGIKPVERTRRNGRGSGSGSGSGLELSDAHAEQTIDDSGDEQPLKIDEHSEKEPKKRGRKKKNSGTGNAVPELIIKSNDDSKQKERILLSLPLNTTDKASSETRKANSPYDVFEFRDSDEDETPQLPLETIHNKNSDINKHQLQQQQQNTQPIQSVVQQEIDKKLDEVIAGAKLDHNEPSKEYVTELSQHGKLSITIRLHQKDSQDGNMAGTAEVVKTSKALASNEDDSKSKLESQLTSNSSNDSTSAKGVRKSARLMSQVPKTSIDETIEDVIKGTCKDEGKSKRITRSSRKSEENIDLDDEHDGMLLTYCFNVISNTIIFFFF